jgi:adenylate cyclase
MKLVPSTQLDLPVKREKGSGILFRLTGIDLANPEHLLPERARSQLAQSRREAQILIGWVQLGIVALFAVLYFAAPKTFSEDAPFAPIPWVLGGYTIFTMVRLYFSYRRALPPWVLVISAIADILILLVAIWSFHIQYGQPAAFYLKAPTLLYVFIFIALRALSFSPIYLLVTGLGAALGWMALLGYAVIEPGGMELVTRDYVEYITSAKILIGAEIDKIISIIVVTVVLAVAVARSRALLVRALAEHTAADNLSRFLEPEVAETLRAAYDVPQLGQGVERNAAVMFIDMRGFSALAAQLAPREIIALLGEYQRLVVPLVHSCGGSIITFLGDGIMITFGAVRSSPSYAADALRCTDMLLSGFDNWNRSRQDAGLPAIKVGIGIETGSVVCGPIGDEQRLEYAVIGDTVNRAAKLQNHTKVEGVVALASVAAFRRALEQGYSHGAAKETREARQVEGIVKPVDLVVLSATDGGKH